MFSDDTLLYRQLFIFSGILFVSVTFSFLMKYYQDEMADVKEEAKAAVSEAGAGIVELLTEDLDPNFDGVQ